MAKLGMLVGAGHGSVDADRRGQPFALATGVLSSLVLTGTVFARVTSGAPNHALLIAFVWHGAPVLLAIGVYAWIAWSRPNEARQVTACTLLFFAVTAVLGFDDLAALDVREGTSRPSWVCAMLLLYALFVQASMSHYVVAVAVASTYLLVGAVIRYALGTYPESSTSTVVWAAVTCSIPTWGCSVIALLLVFRRQEDRARYERTLRELEQLGSYALRTKLGQGGMGEVWRAEHAFLARPAAIKIIRPEVLRGLNGPDTEARARAMLALGRFEREAKAIAQLTSPHTVRVFDFGRGPDNTFFYVMELLDGLDLHRLVARHGAQPQERVRHILLQACDSLAEAHDRGMVHRDIKPANLFLCRMGRTFDHVKILDFGLARSDPSAKPEGVETLPRLTRQGIISGSPHYMSPEQAEGSDDLDRRADIYALGCVAYFLLTGRELFQNENPMVVLMQQVSEIPPPMRRRNPRIVVDPEFEALVLDMLEKNRDRRPGSADDLARRLRALDLSASWDQPTAATWWTRARVPVVFEAAFEENPDPGVRLVRKLN